MLSQLLETLHKISAAFQRGRQFITHDIWRIGRPGEKVPSGLIIKQIRAAILLVRGLMEETLLLRASALTFATLLFLVPFLALMFYFIQTFNLGDQIYEKMDERLSKAVVALRHIGDTEEEGEEETKRQEELDELFPVADENADDNTAVLGVHPENFSGSDEQLKRHLITTLFPILAEKDGITNDPLYQNPVKYLVSFADEAARSPRALGVSGLLFILTTVFGFMRNVEYTFNRIWGVSRQRNPLRVIGHYMLLTFMLPFVAAFIMGISAALENSYVLEILGPAALLLRGAQFLVLSLSFTLVYFFVPNTKVQFRYALIGGLVAASLYMLNSWIYIKFQYGLINYTNFFFAFALFPVLLMYIYFSWLLLLFGALVSFAYQNEKTFALERLAAETTTAYKESLAVRTMLELSFRFKNSLEPLQIKEAAELWNVPTRLLQETLDILKDNRMVIATDSIPSSFHLARSAHSISVLEVVNAIRNTGRDPSLLREEADYKVVYEGLDTADPQVLTQSIQSLSDQILDKKDFSAGGSSAIP